MAGLDVVELGCGTAYFSAWLARRGARAGRDRQLAAQLETARRLQEEFGLEFPLLLGNAEEVPLPDASFDLAISEYGASIWCDPDALGARGGAAPAAGRPARLPAQLDAPRSSARPTSGAAEERLVRPQFGMHRFEWPDENAGVEFHLAHGD